ncbi:hypothetical protein R84B8_02164 [Treponema sp. R8-4-B8]
MLTIIFSKINMEGIRIYFLMLKEVRFLKEIYIYETVF